ncbi:hypothetical protein [Streptomyces sp. NRRL S-646]|uniref:hypothetical protein n=1 Tax=Streptomyces sp. NRRL S-646 TaxID=1463917 RepID=UPI0004C7C542
MSTFAIIAAARESGPFDCHNLLTDMITLQAFNGSAAMTALLLGAVVSERIQTRQELARACGQFADMVARMATGDLRPALPHRHNKREGQGGQAPRRA